MASALRVKRLYLGSIDGPLGDDTPLHCYAIEHSGGVVLVDTGMRQAAAHQTARMTIRPVFDGLADHGIGADRITHVINTHLHPDACGGNVLFAALPVHLQRVELETARAAGQTNDRFDFPGATFELLDGEAEILPGIRVLPTPGHSPGHQSVLIGGDEPELIVGDAAYSVEIWDAPEEFTPQHPAWSSQIRGDVDEWRASIERLHLYAAGARLHFCHDSRIVPPSEAASSLRT